MKRGEKAARGEKSCVKVGIFSGIDCTFVMFSVNVSEFRVYAVVEKQNDVTQLSRNNNFKNKETKQ